MLELHGGRLLCWRRCMPEVLGVHWAFVPAEAGGELAPCCACLFDWRWLPNCYDRAWRKAKEPHFAESIFLAGEGTQSSKTCQGRGALNLEVPVQMLTQLPLKPCCCEWSPFAPVLSRSAHWGCPWHCSKLIWISCRCVIAPSVWTAEEHCREHVGLELPDWGGVWEADEGSAERCRAKEERWRSHQVRQRAITASHELARGGYFTSFRGVCVCVCVCVHREGCRLQQCCPFMPGSWKIFSLHVLLFSPPAVTAVPSLQDCGANLSFGVSQ